MQPAPATPPQRLPRLVPVLSEGPPLPPLPAAARPGGKFAPGRQRYCARLLINGHVVGTSEPVALREDFTADFRDVFRWVLVVAGCWATCPCAPPPAPGRRLEARMSG
jgi:hypothetical protein